MKLGNYDFAHICEITLGKGRDDRPQAFLPQSMYKNARKLPLNRYGVGPFCRFKIPSTFNVSGVYAITCNNDARYVGECQNLSKRFNVGYGNISPRNCFQRRPGDELQSKQSDLCGYNVW